MLDYKLVEAFAVVSTEGGFEKAAKVLHLTQSAVSQRVKLLEEQVGGVLLVRSSPPEPTDAGREMLKHYRKVRQLENDLGPGFGKEDDEFTTLTVGLNADSLATWFFPALEEYLNSEPILLDLRVDDQAKTHDLLRNGDVLGCISDRSEPIQGCCVEYLGDMVYKLYATSEYISKWFKNARGVGEIERAPILIFNRKDLMHGVLLADALGAQPKQYSAFYLPSSEKFATAIVSGKVCGMLPWQQAKEYVERGDLVDLYPESSFSVKLHWHCWNLESGAVSSLTDALVAGARRELAQES